MRRACGGSQPRLDDPYAGRPDWPCNFGDRSALFAPDGQSQELIGFVRCEALIGPSATKSTCSAHLRKSDSAPTVTPQ